MADSPRITFALEGTVSLQDLATVIGSWTKLMDSLGSEVAEGETIRWEVDDLSGGSAEIVLRGEGADVATIERVAEAYRVSMDSVTEGKPWPYAIGTRSHAVALLNVIKGPITSGRYDAPQGGGVAFAPVGNQPALRAQIVESLGAINGMVETLRRRGGLQFTLYDDIFDSAVRCFLSAGQEDMVRDRWGKLVTVRGRVSRNAMDGRPIAIRGIQDIVVWNEEQSGGLIRAAGMFQRALGSSPGEGVRRLRDEWHGEG